MGLIHFIALTEDRGAVAKVGRTLERHHPRAQLSVVARAPRVPLGGSRAETLENGTTLIRTADVGAVAADGFAAEWLERLAEEVSAPHRPGLAPLGRLLTEMGLTPAEARRYLGELYQGATLVLLRGSAEAVWQVLNALEWSRTRVVEHPAAEGDLAPGATPSVGEADGS